MTIYINGIQKNVLILGNENEVLDETLDSANFSYIDSNPLPLAPYQRVEIRHEDLTSSYFVTISDNVEPYTPTSSLYKHEITCAESTRILSKRMLRNSVFSQPPYERKCKTTLTAVPEGGNIVNHTRYRFELLAGGSARGFVFNELTLPSGEKCAKAKVRLRTQFFFGAINGTNYNTTGQVRNFKNAIEFSAFESQFTSLIDEGQVILKYKLNGASREDTLTLDTTQYNYEFESKEIRDLLNQGAQEMYIITNTERPLYYAGVDGFPAETDIDGFENHLIGWNVQFEIIAETYIHTAYSILAEISDRVRQFHKVTSSDGESTITEARGELFRLPQSGELYTLLNNTITPNMTFTQCSVYEAVAEVFRLFDAIFTMDANGVLGITYFNEKTGDATIIDKAVAINSALGEERYINGLMCYYQDARAEDAFPMGEEVYAPLSSKGIGVVANEDKVFRTPHQINDVVSFTQLADIQLHNGSAGYMAVKNFEIDMTDHLFEQSVWSATLDVSDLPSEYDAHKEYITYQADTIYFTKGDRYISLANSYSDSWGHYQSNFVNTTRACLHIALGVYLIRTNTSSYVLLPYSQNDGTSYDWSIPRFKVEYHTSSNGVFKVESYANKYEGEMPIDQASGSIDLGKAGLNLLGLSFKMGEPTLNVTHRATSWENRIQKGFVLTYQGEQWTANNCRYTCIAEDTYQGQISFVKNYNELSLNKKVLREKRLSSVSNELTIKSEEILTEYCYVSDANDLTLYPYSCWDFPTFFKCIANTFGCDTDLKCLNDVHYLRQEGVNYKRIYVPTLRYGAGDVVCFEMSYEDAMVANINFKSTQGFWGTTAYYSSYVLYTDSQGKIDTMDIQLRKNESVVYTDDFPVLPTYTYSNAGFTIDDYQVHKQPNEVFALNYQIAFIPKDPKKVIIGKAFIEDNFFVKGKLTGRKFLIYASNETYSVLDTKGKGTSYANQGIVFTREEDYCLLRFGGSDIPSHNSWAVCDENGNILFAVNSSGNSLYFTLRSTRL